MMITKDVFKVLLLMLVVLFTACKSTKNVTKNILGTEIAVPCTGDNFSSDKDFIRASASAESLKMDFSKEKAIETAKNRLAGKIESKLKSVFDRYRNERGFGKDLEYEEKTESLIRDVVKIQINNFKTICEKTFTKDDKYQTFICLEVKREDLLNSTEAGISKDKKLQIDYDKMKFEQIFDEEMKILEEKQSY